MGEILHQWISINFKVSCMFQISCIFCSARFLLPTISKTGPLGISVDLNTTYRLYVLLIFTGVNHGMTIWYIKAPVNARCWIWESRTSHSRSIQDRCYLHHRIRGLRNLINLWFFSSQCRNVVRIYIYISLVESQTAEFQTASSDKEKVWIPQDTQCREKNSSNRSWCFWGETGVQPRLVLLQVLLHNGSGRCGFLGH